MSWVDEVKFFGPTSGTPHFAPGDVDFFDGNVLESEHWRLNHEYALWSLVELDQAPAFATQRSDSFFPDPEYDPQDRGLELFNVQSAQSLRLRSLLEEQPKKNATSKHDVLTVGLTCAVLTLEQLLTQVKLWFGPDPVSPERSGFPSLRAVAHDGALTRAVGFVEALIYGDDPPARHELPAELLGRTGAALALHGHNLLVASGAQESTLATDLWLVDLHTGQAALLREDLPPRRGARLSVTPSGSHVHLAGGRDASGARHDDVWQLSDFRAVPGDAAPRRLYADTSDRDTFEPRTSPLVYDAVSGDLLQVRFDAAHVQGAALRQRTSFGWESLGEDGMPAACAPGDPGGNLCPLTTAWWASPGRLPCAGGSCSGSAGAIERTDALGPATLRADADQDGVWLLKAARLERWQRASDGPLMRTASLALPKLARDVAARRGRALVATIDGVHLARDTAGAATLSPRLKLCGSPYRVAAVGDDIWAVATTLGLALVGEVEGELRVESVSLLLPHGLTPLPAGPAGELACTLASSLHAVGALLGPTSAFADAGRGRLLLASARHLLDIDVTRPTTPTLRGMIDLSHALSNLRVDTSQQRAYGAGVLPSYDPAFDLRGPTAALAGSHEVASWVKRRDAGAFRVRQVALRTEAAQVVP
ncbi:MAG: hypothetical protein KF718_33835 [Polyangiaceae bacterium]|nr:hypothetical protein [Polyangiaceae bacterium]